MMARRAESWRRKISAASRSGRRPLYMRDIIMMILLDAFRAISSTDKITLMLAGHDI